MTNDASVAPKKELCVVCNRLHYLGNACEEALEAETMERCPTCGSDDRTGATYRFAGLLCHDPWHTSASVAPPTFKSALEAIANDPISGKETLDAAANWYRSIAKRALDGVTGNEGKDEMESRGETPVLDDSDSTGMVGGRTAHPLPDAPLLVEAREPHDGWMNAWLYKNSTHDQDVTHLWNPETRKMAGDWADFRISHAPLASPAVVTQQFFDNDWIGKARHIKGTKGHVQRADLLKSIAEAYAASKVAELHKKAAAEIHMLERQAEDRKYVESDLRAKVSELEAQLQKLQESYDQRVEEALEDATLKRLLSQKISDLKAELERMRAGGKS